MPGIFTIPPHRAFADALAAGLARRHGPAPDAMARGLILLPNNRAVRAVTDAFVRRAGGGLVLPRLAPIGDPDLGERVGGALEPIGEGEEVPPAIEPMERLMLLARLVQRHGGQDAGEALRLAEDLARVLDQLLVEEVDPGRLAGFAADMPDLSLHWQKSLDRLRLILADWPALLERRGRIDLAARRGRLLDALAARWRRDPPSGFVCAAGIGTAAPAVARLLRVVARMESGSVILPGFDPAMPDEEWEALGPHDPDPATGRRVPSIETHPQYQMKRLLDLMGVARGEVRTWRHGGGHDAPAARGRAIANALAPAAFTAKWQALPPAARRLSGVRALELADPAGEATAIAVALREAMETPGRTAALVTPDRALARRVSAHLRRWGIVADDSAGRPLAQTPPGTLIGALAGAAAQRFAPVPLLALLKHPLARQGPDRLAWLDGARALDLALRGPRPPAGLAGIAGFLAESGGRDARLRAPAAKWWDEAAALLAPLEASFEAPAPRLDALVAALREAASALSDDAVWTGPAGREAAAFLAALEPAAADGPDLADPALLPAMLERLMAGVAVRPPYGQHPRLFIWGLIEARLQQADLMILAGLNEGTWPALPTPDPWLAPRLRAELGLPGLERRIGLAAHDLAGSLGAPQVLVTRARRDARAPAVASRFWLRLEAMTGGMTRAPRIAGWAAALERADAVAPAARPAPAPPAALRPRRIAVTDVDRLKADPFAFYARKMLGLAALDPIDADPGPAWRGTAVHDILECWFRDDDCDPAALRPRAEALLGASGVHPLMRALWQPRLLEAIDWVAAEIARCAADGRRPLLAETWGETELAGVTLGGKADRIDRDGEGDLVIVDYKTGTPPGAKAVAAGFAMQLGLIGLIAERGGFPGLSGVPAGFEYWSLARKDGRLGHVRSAVGGRSGIDPRGFTALAAHHFADAAGRWLTGTAPFTAKLNPAYAPYGDYDQLMRLDEWYGRER